MPYGGIGPLTTTLGKGSATPVRPVALSFRAGTTLFAIFLSVQSPSAKLQMRTPSAQRFHQVHQAMGTEFRLDLYAPDQQTADHVCEQAFEEIDRLEALLSNYRAASELSRIGREIAGGPVTTDPETFAFLERALFWSRESDGAFDLTVGPLLRAWGFFAHGGRIPSRAERSALRSQVGWRHLQLDPADRTVRSTPRQALELDPGSIGKGFAVDHVIAGLREQGITAAFLSAGNSTLYGLGAPPGTAGWPVNVPDPHHPGHIAATILLRDSSLSTGACTEKFFIRNGHRFCHIFDPRSGRPVEGMLQTTVIDPSATDSDVLSTIAFVLAPEFARRLFDQQQPGRRVLIFGQPPSRPACVAINWGANPCSSPKPSSHKDPPS